MGLICIEIHGDTLRYLLIPSPKGQVGGSNPLRDANGINGLRKIQEDLILKISFRDNHRDNRSHYYCTY
jgi:hypothetical protein